MKIQLLSDVHNEIRRDMRGWGGQEYMPAKTDADVVVLPGDIDTKCRGVIWAQLMFPDKPVIYVLGNHEYYKGQLGNTLQKMKDLAKGSNVHVLENEELVIDSVRFLGSTCWTDYKLTGNQYLAAFDAEQQIRDFKHIRSASYRKLHASDFATLHRKSVQWLREKFEEPFDGKTVVVTHHAPSELSIHPSRKQRYDHLSSAYASDLSQLMGYADLWLHGHTHDRCDYDLGGTRVINHPVGYPTERTGFDEDWLIELN